MFIVTEGMGNMVAQIAQKAGIRPSELVITEDRLTVVFDLGTSQKADMPPSEEFPEGPWVRGRREGNKNTWICRGHRATLTEIASAFGVTAACMEYRLRAGDGMAVPMGRKSRKVRKPKAEAMALAAGQTETKGNN